MELQTYKEFRPTAFDTRGLALPDRQDWIVCPVSHNRDSDILIESNWACQLARLGGESDTVEIHRFGHWGPGWFEIVIVDPADTSNVESMRQLAHELADYPVMDDSDLSAREEEQYTESWANWACSDFLSVISKAFELSADTKYALDDIDPDKVRELYESGLPSGDYHDLGSPTGSRFKSSCLSLTRGNLAQWIKVNRVRRKTTTA